MRRYTGAGILDFGCGASACTRSHVENMFRSRVPYHGLKHLSAQLAGSMANVPVPEVEIDGKVSSYGLRELYRALTREHARKIGLSLPSCVTTTEAASHD